MAFADWRWDDPQPQGNALFAAAVSAGSDSVAVAVGEHGTLLRSAAGASWSSHGPVAGGATLSGIAWVGNRFVACGPQAGLWASSDGLAWSQIDGAAQALHVLPADGKTVALGASTAWVSSGGAFAAQSLADAGIASYRGAVSTGSKILLYGSAGFLATSTDGATWTKSSPSADVSFYSAAGGVAGFLVGGIDNSGNGVLRSSPDGSAWSSVSLPAARFFPVRIFRLSNGWLVQDYWSGALYRRADAQAEWSRVESDLPGFYPSASVVAADGRVFFFGDRGVVATLEAGRLVPQLSGVIDTAYLYAPRFSAACAGDIFAAIDANVSSAAFVRYYLGTSSSSGVAWQKPSPAPVRGLTALAAIGNSSLVGFSSGAQGDTTNGLTATDEGFYRTTNGVTWQEFGRVKDPQTSQSLLQGTILSIAPRPDESAVVVLTRSEVSTPGGYGAVRSVYRTTNWSDWQQISLPEFRAAPPVSEETMESVAWDGQKFVLLLYPGRVFTSTDGQVWKQLPSLPAGLAGVSVASGGGLVVARTAALRSDGSYGAESSGGEKICVYQDGRWWPRDTGRRPPVLQRQIIRAGDTFVASGRGAEVLTSSDGFAWTAHAAPGAPYALLWNGDRLAGFNDSFAAFSRQGLPAGGTPLGTAAITPRTRSAPAQGEAYTVSLDIAPGTAWSVGAVPSWITVSPLSGSGPAQLDVTLSANTGKTPRGATLNIAGESHFVFQQAPVPLPPAVLSGTGGALKIAFSGDWNIVVPAGLLSVAKNAVSGAGPISLTVAPNDSTAPRTVTVNINGTDYAIEQQGTPLGVLRAGSYAGLVGYLEPAASSALLDDYTAAFEGSLRVVVAPPGKTSAQGSYSAQLTFHNGTKPLVFRGAGALGADGTVTNALWSVGPKGPHITITSLSVVRDGPDRQYLHGEFENAGFRFGLLAGRNVFSAKTNPLSSDFARRATFFLTAYGGSGTSADTGAGSVAIGADGVARIAGVLATGAKFTASSVIWGAVEPQPCLPFNFIAGPSLLMCGFSRYDVSAPFTDWDGLASLVVPGTNQSGQPETKLAFLSASLCTYTPPAKGASSFTWSSPASLQVGLSDGTEIQGEVTSPSPGKLTVNANAGTKMTLSFDARSGLVKGSLVASPGAKAVKVFGGLTLKQFNVDGDAGGFLGMVLGPPSGQFEISPP